MNKSLIRHVLTALGTIALVLGLNFWVPVIDYLKDNLDAVWAASAVVVGFVVQLIGFFKNKERFDTTTPAE